MKSRWLIFSGIIFLVSFMPFSPAASDVSYEWSGHIRANGSVDYFDEDHLLAEAHENQQFFNAGFDTRINASIYWGNHTSFNFGYEGVLSGGQTRETIAGLFLGDGNPDATLIYQMATPSDDQQLFSLTKIIQEEDAYIFYHRIDRLFLAYDNHFGNISIGRQPLTWGNGLLFNPADLVNPFAPSDIIRDYKIGSDMILYQHGFDFLSDLQLVMVPRRESEDNDLSFAESTLGLKFRLSGEEKDFDFYLLKNYQDPVVGTGFITYLGEGVLRSDLTWTYLPDDPESDSFFSAIVNYDYSWIWLEKNWYGFIELYYNGLGSSDVFAALQNEPLRDRLTRGEIFVTGRYYLNTMLQYEAHPLVNIYSTLIYNLEDNSFLFQPRLSWDLSSFAQLLFGINIAVGSENSEFGQHQAPEIGDKTGNPSQVYLVFTCFF